MWSCKRVFSSQQVWLCEEALPSSLCVSHASGQVAVMVCASTSTRAATAIAELCVGEAVAADSAAVAASTDLYSAWEAECRAGVDAAAPPEKEAEGEGVGALVRENEGEGEREEVEEDLVRVNDAEGCRGEYGDVGERECVLSTSL